MRKLNLKKETLAELSPDELGAIVGAGGSAVCATGVVPCLGSAQCSYDDGCVTARACLTHGC